jgi:hypothetical protein
MNPADLKNMDDETLESLAQGGTMDFYARGCAAVELRRQAKQREFEQGLAQERMAQSEALARLQMAHADNLAISQDRTAKRVASATVFAAIAAGLSAIGVVVTAALELAKYLAGP